MAAAEALLAYEPLQQLQHENFLLREETRRVRSEVRELLAWKEKAMKHMAEMAPARQRAAREIERAKQLQLQLRTVERSIKSRGALEVAMAETEAERETLQQHVKTLQRENATLRSQGERRKRRADEAEAQLAAIGESFRLHLERLVAMREKLDEAASEDVKSKNNKGDEKSAVDITKKSLKTASCKPSKVAYSTIDDQNPVAAPNEEESATSSSSYSSPPVSMNSAALVTGLDMVAKKCLTWFQGHLAQSIAQQRLKIAQYEAQRVEIKHLEEQVHAASQIPDQLAKEHDEQTRELSELREAYAQVQQRVADAQHKVTMQQQRREDMAARLRLVVGEVRQYLRLVRVEIKRKFGYLPEAIAHAESWTRIAEALELLKYQGTDRCIVRSAKPFEGQSVLRTLN